MEHIENLPQLITHSSQTYPSHKALILGDQQVSFSDLNSRSDAVASFLTAEGLKPGDKVGILSENCPEWVAVFFGISKAGGIAVCMDPYSNEEEYRFILSHTNAPFVFISESFKEVLNKIAPDTPSLKKIISLQDIHTFENREISIQDPDPEDTAIIIYTSGTTGSQKGVVLTHKNIIANIKGTSEILPLKPKQRLLNLLPLSHMFGITGGLLIPMYNGMSVIFSESLRGPAIVKAMNENKSNILITVPLVLSIFKKMISKQIHKSSPLQQRIFNSSFWLCRNLHQIGIHLGRFLFKKIHQSFGGNLNFMVSGGAPLDPEIESFFSTIGIPILNGYGLTETSPVVSLPSPKQVRKGSVGRPLPGIQVRFNDTKGIEVKGPNVMKGYYRNPEATSQVLEDGWFQTGDIGELDRKGFLFIKGREKNVVVTSGGLNIFPEEVETFLAKSRYIKEICVMGIDQGKGEKLIAVIYPDPETVQTEGEKIEELFKEELDQLQKNVPLYKKVTSFKLLEEEFPKTSTQKIKRKLLKEMIIKG